jgi:hypothetical protein
MPVSFSSSCLAFSVPPPPIFSPALLVFVSPNPEKLKGKQLSKNILLD